MKKMVLRTQYPLLVDFTLHNFSATLLTEFAEKIVTPYFSGNMNNAVKDLMQKAIDEEEIAIDHLKLVKKLEK